VESQSKVEKELNKHNRGKAIRSRLKGASYLQREGEKERRREGEKAEKALRLNGT
jgi:hypothetical protein